MLPESVFIACWEGEWGVYDISADHPLDALRWFPTEESVKAWLAESGYHSPLTDLPNYYERQPAVPEFVTVTRTGLDQYRVSDGPVWLFGGTPGQVHNWLGQRNYKLVTFAPGSWLAGTYKRPKEVVA